MLLYTKIKNFHHQLPILGKLLTAFTLFLAAFATISVYSCEKHESCQITFGNPAAKLAVTQHFALGSLEFVRFVKEEFPALKAKFIDTGLVSWTFCPHIVDLATIQLVFCLETLSFSQKTDFFNRVLLELNPKASEGIPQILMRSIESLSIPEKKVGLVQLLKLEEIFNQGCDFFNQNVFVKPPSSIEIGTQVLDYFIHLSAIRHQIEKQLMNKS